MSRTEADVLAAIERRRRRPPVKLMGDRVTLAHGAGGKATRTLVEGLFARELANPLLEPLSDAALLPPAGVRTAFTTDAHVVTPLEFPGGDIGSLAVHGTVNDLAVSGARPAWLSAAFVLEEGVDLALLTRVVRSMAAAAAEAGVAVVAGDTKVVERGKADGMYVVTAGVGVLEHDLVLGPEAIRPGDRVLVSGPIGDHGTAIMVARGGLDLEVDVRSDTAAVGGLVAALLDAAGDGVRCMRDPTRGGVATACNELAMGAELALVLHEDALPVRAGVIGVCEILGLDPLYVACEGRVLAVVAPEAADAALAALRAHPLGEGAAVIGEVRPDPPGMVLLETALGGSRVVDVLAGDPLPRIC